MIHAVLQVFSGTEDRVCQSPGQVVLICFPVRFHRLPERSTLVVGIPSQEVKEIYQPLYQKLVDYLAES